MHSINPTTGTIIATYTPHDAAAIDAALTRAERAYAQFRHTPLAERAALLRRAAAVLDTQRDDLARLMTDEMGKPIGAARAEVEKCAWVCRFYAERGADFLAEQIVETDASYSAVRYDPLGPILAIMPWNFPLWQVFRWAAPALMAGNVGLLKHASNVCGCALAIERVWREAGAAEGVFQTLLIRADAVEQVLADRRVVAATLTGSAAAGRAVAAAAGKQLKKTVLELGGSDPFIVLADADIERSLATAVTARTINNGQSCIAAKRFIIADAIADRWIAGFVERFAALTVGDPHDEATDIGPLATEAVRADLVRQVDESVNAGAALLLGGTVLDRLGWFYAPTVLAQVRRGMPAYDEELFGPVASVFRVGDLEAALDLANATTFGLGASVWTNDDAEAEHCIRELEAGSVFINGMVKSDPRLPFGGVRQSGYGRELSEHGIREWTNIKTVWRA